MFERDREGERVGLEMEKQFSSSQAFVEAGSAILILIGCQS